MRDSQNQVLTGRSEQIDLAKAAILTCYRSMEDLNDHEL